MILLPLASTLALGQSSASAHTPASPDRPEALAQRLYQQVLARPSVGIPYGTNLKIYAPYLSRALLQRMDVAIACSRDFYRQHPVDPKLLEKPPFAWLELGTFTGGDDEEEFHAFDIEGIPPEKPWFSHVSLIIRREKGHYVVDDIIYLKAREGDVDWRLTQALSSGCNGRHWVG
jgi:hypothetical protein